MDRVKVMVLVSVSVGGLFSCMPTMAEHDLKSEDSKVRALLLINHASACKDKWIFKGVRIKCKGFLVELLENRRS